MMSDRKWTAGLSDATGEFSYFTVFEKCEVMLHVSTLLPYRPGDPQQIERKRHLGNDVVLLVFKEASGPREQISPTTFKSNFNRTSIGERPVVRWQRD
jgi:hypothetical protein